MVKAPRVPKLLRCMRLPSARSRHSPESLTALCPRPRARTEPEGLRRPCSARGRLAELGIERGVHRVDQITLHGRGFVLGGGKRYDDLERVFGRAAIEQHARSRISEHARMGF